MAPLQSSNSSTRCHVPKTFDASSMSTTISVRHGKEAVKLALEKKTPQNSLNSPQLAVECHQRFQELKSHMIGTAGDILDILAWRLCNAVFFSLFFSETDGYERSIAQQGGSVVTRKACCTKPSLSPQLRFALFAKSRCRPSDWATLRWHKLAVVRGRKAND